MALISEDAEHLARLLLLVDAFGQATGTGLDGLTKLAKLDFLLRYPGFLQSLLAKQHIAAMVDLADHELQAISDPMIRYRYGPWDNRYYELLGGLVGRGLVEYVKGRGRVSFRATTSAHQIASDLRGSPEWSTIVRRIQLLHEHFDIGGTQLKKLIYDSFPALVALPWRAVIQPAPDGESA